MKELFENYNNFCNYVIEANPNYDDESFTFEKFMDWYASLPYYSDGKGHSQGDNKKYMKIEKLSIGNLNQAELENREKINEIVEAINLMSVGNMEEIINIQAPKKDYCNIAFDINILRQKGLEGWRLVAVSPRDSSGSQGYYVLERDIY